jgi:hypothetical protein
VVHPLCNMESGRRESKEERENTYVARTHEGIENEARIGQHRRGNRVLRIDGPRVRRPRASHVGILQVVPAAVGLAEGVRRAE